jgi:hypothetical protein
MLLKNSTFPSRDGRGFIVSCFSAVGCGAPSLLAYTMVVACGAVIIKIPPSVKGNSHFSVNVHGLYFSIK